MSEFPFIDADRLGRVLPMEAAVDALEAAFGSDALPAAPLRTHIETGAGSLVAMPATGPLGTGVKLLTVTPGNAEVGRPLIQGLYVLFSVGTQEPEAAIDGEAITALRTGAVSGLATRFLAREEPAHLLIFGAGTQARAHLEAMLAVRPVDRLTLVSRTARGIAIIPRMVPSTDLRGLRRSQPVSYFFGGRAGRISTRLGRAWGG